MRNIQKKLREKVQEMSDKRINWCLSATGILALFAKFDIETLKKIELYGIADIANTADNFAAPILGLFENRFVDIFLYILFVSCLLLRIYKSAIHPRVMIISHSSFSNTQTTYDRNIFSGYSIKETEINLVENMSRHNIVDAIRVQDSLIEEVLNSFDKYTELAYYGIAHIPLVFRAGFQVGDEGNVRLLHKYRNHQSEFKEISNEPDNGDVNLQYRLLTTAGSSKEMLVVIATSLPVVSGDLVAFHCGNELYIEMEDKSMYGFDAVDSYAAMNRLRSGILGKIRETVVKNNIERIHLVLATSSDFTFFLAQGFSKTHDPEIIVYQYERSNPQKYPWGISNKALPASAVIRQPTI